jgi:hypothetical protein
MELKEYIKNQITKLESHKQELISYANMKLNSTDDYHGVCDAGMDIRDAEAEMKAYRDILNKI